MNKFNNINRHIEEHRSDQEVFQLKQDVAAYKLELQSIIDANTGLRKKYGARVDETFEEFIDRIVTGKQGWYAELKTIKGVAYNQHQQIVDLRNRIAFLETVIKGSN